MSSSICSCISRAVTALQRCRMRSDSVVLPWSMWATIEKLRMQRGSVIGERRDDTGFGPQVPRGHRDRAGARAGSLGPSRRKRRRPAQAIMAALSVVKARSGSRTGTRCRRAPGRERGAQLRVGGHAARERERPHALVAVDRLDAVEQGGHDRVLEGRAAGRRGRARGRPGRAASRRSPRFSSSRSIAVFRPENEKSRDAVVGRVRWRSGWRSARAAGGDAVDDRVRRGNRARRGGRSCRTLRRARRRACGRWGRSTPSSTRTSSAWPPETTRPWKGYVTGSGASPPARRNAEKRCPSR